MADNYSERASRGQALNLAVNEAIQRGLTEDRRFILTRYLEYYALSNLVQEISIEEIKDTLGEKS